MACPPQALARHGPEQEGRDVGPVRQAYSVDVALNPGTLAASAGRRGTPAPAVGERQ